MSLDDFTIHVGPDDPEQIEVAYQRLIRRTDATPEMIPMIFGDPNRPRTGHTRGTTRRAIAHNHQSRGAPPHE